jgi:hypothetical protein
MLEYLYPCYFVALVSINWGLTQFGVPQPMAAIAALFLCLPGGFLLNCLCDAFLHRAIDRITSRASARLSIEAAERNGRVHYTYPPQE